MRITRSITAVALLAFLSATMPAPARAQSAPGAPTPLRASIDRAGVTAAQAAVPARRPTPVHREQMMGGGGGGGAGTMVMTLLMTAASLAGTYYLVKEMRKSNDQAAKSGQ